MQAKIPIITLKIFIEVRAVTWAKGNRQFSLGKCGNY